MTLETERLVMRPFGLDDLDELAPLHGEESFWWYPYRRGQTRDETRTFLEKQLGRAAEGEPTAFATRERTSGALIGWIGLKVPHSFPQVLPAVEVTWRLGRTWWGRGLATEGAAAAVGYGFATLDLDEIVGLYDPDNAASGRVMDRLGFVPDRATTDSQGGTVNIRRLPRRGWSSM